MAGLCGILLAKVKIIIDLGKMTMSKSTREIILLNLERSKLSFSHGIEEAFRQDYYLGSLKTMRIALLLALALYAVFGVLDVVIAPRTKNTIWFIRFVVVIPVLLVVLSMTYVPLFRKIIQYALSASSIVMGAGIITMIAIARNIESGLYYYAGLMLVIMWSYTFVRLRFVFATLSCWFIVAGYEISAIIFQDMLSSEDLLKAFINNNFFFISANIIGMFVCYHIETYARRDFLQRLLIMEEQKELQRERQQLVMRNEIMENDLQMARNIQQELIPGSAPFDFIASLFKPMEPVGGDFFDFIQFRERDKVGIFISDVSGHGASAALITSMIKSIILKSGKHKDDPAQLLFSLNNSLINQTGGNYVTAFYCVYNMSDRTISYSNAGHVYPLLICDGDIKNLSGAGSVPLAIFTAAEIQEMKNSYRNACETLPPGSKLLLYTDGLMEASPDRDRSRMFSNISHDIILDLRHLKCDAFIQSLYEKLVAHTGGENFDDDVCLICADIE